ncbi:hypothetical protein ACO0SA_000905 [Hanseniaspora valbyensis]
MSTDIQNEVPEPPSNTALNSSLNGEKPRTLWMGDLDPLFNEDTLKQIWKYEGFKVKIKLIKNKKNLLIPCSNKFQNDNFKDDSENSPNSSNSSSKKDVIEINGMKFVDPTTTSLHHSGYCFVEFESFELASEGLRFNILPIPNFKFTPDFDDLSKLEMINQNSNIDDSKVKVFYTNKNNDRCFRLNWASSTTLNSPSVQTPEYSMFVGDLLPDTTEIQVMVFFQRNYKSVKTVRIMTDPVSGKSRCFGFVRFGNKQEREDCVKTMNGMELNGKPIKCALAAPRAGSKQNMIDTTDFRGKARNSHNRSRSYDFNKNGSNPGYMHRKTQSIPTNNYYRSQGTEKFCLFVGGLNKNLDEGELFTCFQKMGKILKIKTYADKGCAFIEFDKKNDALKAISELDGFVLSSTNVPIRVNWSRDSYQSKSPSEAGKISPLDSISVSSNDEFRSSIVGGNNLFNQDPRNNTSAALGYTPSYERSNMNSTIVPDYAQNYNYNFNQQQQVSPNNPQQQFGNSFNSNFSTPFDQNTIQPTANFNQHFTNSSTNTTSNFVSNGGINRQIYYNNMNLSSGSDNVSRNMNRRSSLLASPPENERTNNSSNVITNPSLLAYLRNNPDGNSHNNTNDKSIWDN